MQYFLFFVDRIRNYFGDEIAIYFAFVRLLALFLFPPALLPFLQYLWPEHLLSRHATIAAFNMIWMTVFLEIWKRSSNRMALRWGTINRSSLERPRPAYFGQLQRSDVTGLVERWAKVENSASLITALIYMYIRTHVHYYSKIKVVVMQFTSRIHLYPGINTISVIKGSELFEIPTLVYTVIFLTNRNLVTSANSKLYIEILRL